MRSAFTRWVLDGRVVHALGAAQAQSAADVAASILAAEGSRSALLALIRAAQPASAAFPFTLTTAPYLVLERVDAFAMSGTFQAVTGHAAVRTLFKRCMLVSQLGSERKMRRGLQLSGDAAKAALLAWAARALDEQAARFTQLKTRFYTDKLRLPTCDFRDDAETRRVFGSVAEAARRSLQLGCLSLLRGPRTAADRSSVPYWTRRAVEDIAEIAGEGENLTPLACTSPI